MDGGEGGRPNEAGAEGRFGRAEGGDALGAAGSGRTGEEDGGRTNLEAGASADFKAGTTGGQPSEIVPLSLTGKEATSNIQNETLVETAIDRTVEPPGAGVVVERVETGESPCREQGEADSQPMGSSTESDCSRPENGPEPVSLQTSPIPAGGPEPSGSGEPKNWRTPFLEEQERRRARWEQMRQAWIRSRAVKQAGEAVRSQDTRGP